MHYEIYDEKYKHLKESVFVERKASPEPIVAAASKESMNQTEKIYLNNSCLIWPLTSNSSFTAHKYCVATPLKDTDTKW